MVGQVRLADLAAVDTRAAEVCVVRETHGVSCGRRDEEKVVGGVGTGRTT